MELLIDLAESLGQVITTVGLWELAKHLFLKGES